MLRATVLAFLSILFVALLVTAAPFVYWWFEYPPVDEHKTLKEIAFALISVGPIVTGVATAVCAVMLPAYAIPVHRFLRAKEWGSLGAYASAGGVGGAVGLAGYAMLIAGPTAACVFWGVARPDRDIP